ncbi:hypothetical protein A10D4_08889 [Idiomarina xiamenensis 10-D-4]|uniref:Alpha/beta hydrolase n=2 Tax=Idiomarina xiamenensis TaxID=1207041 RepID=K2K5Q4_9GAMM|nr:hypothetical protein A10D4_08889 [Idiomarina xiamenensis 10-D-4]
MLFFTVFSVLAGCSARQQSNQTNDIQTQAATEVVMTSAYDAHFLRCRGNDAGQLQSVLNKALSSTGVILYFHGGLSSDNYMRTNLGPALLESMFTEANLNGLYPIFVNYDAGVLDDVSVGDLITSAAYQNLQSRVLSRLNLESNNKGLKLNNQVDVQQAAMSVLIGVGADGSNLKSNFKQNAVDDNERFAAAVLAEQKELAIAASNIQQRDPELYKAAQQFAELYNELETDPAQKKAKSLFIGINASKMLAKIFARFALTLNHQIEPTIFEEVVRELSLFNVINAGAVMQSHWTKVKKHSEECWQDGSNGARLIAQLLAHQAEHSDFKISAISHSAGSIVIGDLLKHLAANGDGKLDNTVLLVPAISLELFQQSFMKYPERVGKLKAYVLADSYERRDELFGGIYAASLLYGVSGIGETDGFGDKPLLLERHLGSKKHPYDKWYYRLLLGEDIRPVWQFVEQHPGLVEYYPFNPANDSGATHECTKYPWRVADLAKLSMAQLSGLAAENVTILVPHDAPTCKPAGY